MSTVHTDHDQRSQLGIAINELTLKTLESYARAKDQEAAVEFYLALIAQSVAQANSTETDKQRTSDPESEWMAEDPLNALFRTLLTVSNTIGTAELARFAENGQWNFAEIRITLDELLTMSEAQLDQKVILDYANLQEFANAWPDTEGILMNDHGRNHLLIVLNKLKVLMHLYNKFSPKPMTTGQRRELKTGVIFHDSGMAIAGRKNHEQIAIDLLRSGEVIEGWDPADPFCARVEHLILYHCTSKVEANLELVRQDSGLAMVIMADELHLERRGIASLLQPKHVSYVEDPWIRIAQHIKSSMLQREVRGDDVYMIWDIHYDPREINRVQTEMVELYHQEKQRAGDSEMLVPTLDIIEDLDCKIFSEKYALLVACAEALFGFGTKVGVRCNNTFYEVNEVGIIYS